jgi:molybdopterin-guanine dinucleotide biosynthesis protein A
MLVAMGIPDHGPVPAAILLTGGGSRRMGFDKAAIDVAGTPSAVHIARQLLQVVGTAVEVGPGRSGLRAVREEPPGSGPLAAMVAGARALRASGHEGPALVVACDLPGLTVEALTMLAWWPGEASVVPVVDGRPQPLCARWSAGALRRAEGLVAEGERSMRAVLASPGRGGLELAGPDRWPTGVTDAAFADADTPEDLERLGLGRREVPPAARSR